MKKLLCLCLAAMTLLTLCACHRDDDAIEPPPAVSQTMAAGAEQVQQPARQLTVQAPDGGVFVDLASCGGQVYASVRYDAGEQALFDGGMTAAGLDGANAVFAVDPDTGALTQLCGRDGGGIWDFVPMPDGTVWAWVYAAAIPAPGEDGDMQTTSTLFHLDSANTALAAVDVAELTGGGETGFSLQMAPLDDSTLAVTWGDGSGCTVKALDSGGNVSGLADADGGGFTDLARMEDGSLMGIWWTLDEAADSSSYSIARLDPAARKITQMSLPDGAELHPGDKNPVQCGDGARLYLEDFDADVSVYDAADRSLTPAFNWLDLGVTGGGYGLPAKLFYRDGALWAAAVSEDQTTVDIFPVDAAGGGRETLTLASFESSDAALASAVADFNRTNSQYRIAVKYYSEFFDGLAQFNYDVIAGDVPDILSLYRMPYDTLRHQGMLADLTSCIDNDADIRREDYLDWSWQADTAADGGIWSLVTRFAFGGYWGRAGDELTRENFTLDKYLTLAESGEELEYANGDGPEYRAWIVEALVAADLARFADTDTAQCHFDSPEFARILTAVQNMAIATGDRYQTTRIERSGIIDGYRGYYYQRQDGYPVALGDPTAEGGRFYLRPQQELAMSSRTEHPDACWQFIRSFLLPAYQQQENVTSLQGFPVLKSALDTLAARETDPAAQQVLGECTQADVDAVNAIFDSGDIYVDRLESMADTVCEILHEELIPFFSGAVDADTVTADLQSRVGLYLSEHS